VEAVEPQPVLQPALMVLQLGNARLGSSSQPLPAIKTYNSLRRHPRLSLDLRSLAFVDDAQQDRVGRGLDVLGRAVCEVGQSQR